MSVIDMATYSYNMVLDSKGFSSKLKDAESSLDSFSMKGNSISGFLKGSLKGGLIGLGAAATAAAGYVSSTGISFDRMKEQSQIAWTTLLGGAKQANNMIGELQTMAAKTPFSFESADKAAKLLKSMGFSAKEIIPDLKTLGDATSAVGGSQEDLEGVATAIGQMNAKQKVSAEEMQQLVERGIPAWGLMAKGMGMSTKELMNMSAQGKIMSSDAIPAMMKAMNEQFGGAMQKQSQSFNGLMSNMGDDIQQISGMLMQPMFDGMKNGLSQVVQMLDGFLNSLKTNGIKETFADIFGFVNDGGMNMFGNLIQSVQNCFATIQPILTDMGNFFNSVITNIKTFWAENGQQMMQAWTNIFNAIAAYVNYIMPMIQLTFKTAWDVIKTIFTLALNVIEGAWKIFAGVFTGDWGKVWEGIKQILGGVLDAIKSLISIAWNYISGTTKFIFSGVAKVISSIWGGIKSFFGSIVGGIKSLVSSGWNGIKSITGSIFNGVASIAGGIWHGISSTVSGIVHGMGSAISSAWSFIKSATSSAFHAVVGFIKNPLKSINLYDIGVNIIKGLGNGIKSMAGWVWDQIKSIGNGIKNGIKSVLGIHSPSRVMAEMGAYVTQGLANGMAGNVGLVDKATQGLADSVMGFNTMLSAPGYRYQALPNKSSIPALNGTTKNVTTNTSNSSVGDINIKIENVSIPNTDQDGVTKFMNTIANNLKGMGLRLA